MVLPYPCDVCLTLAVLTFALALQTFLKTRIKSIHTSWYLQKLLVKSMHFAIQVDFVAEWYELFSGPS